MDRLRNTRFADVHHDNRSDCYAHPYRVQYAVSICHAYLHLDAHLYVDSNQHLDADQYRNRNKHMDANAYLDSKPRPVADCLFHGNTDMDAYRVIHAYRVMDANLHLHTDVHLHAH